MLNTPIPAQNQLLVNRLANRNSNSANPELIARTRPSRERAAPAECHGGLLGNPCWVRDGILGYVPNFNKGVCAGCKGQPLVHPGSRARYTRYT